MVESELTAEQERALTRVLGVGTVALILVVTGTTVLMNTEVIGWQLGIPAAIGIAIVLLCIVGWRVGRIEGTGFRHTMRTIGRGAIAPRDR